MLITNRSKYLVVPTSRTAEKSKLRLFEGELLLLDLDATVDFEHPETVFYYDLTPFMNRELTVSHASGKSFGFSENKPPVSADKYRPELHFTAERGWINDPNGLCFYEGKYHLFFQHNPIGLNWGNMHWGHAVSDDLFDWRELGDVLYPDELGDMFSGSAIVDTENLLGLKENEHDVLVLFYTAAGNGREISKDKPCTQCMAYSTDGGFTFKKWANNPVVPHIKGANRDPKVVRDPSSGIFVMSLYLDGDEYAVLTSENLADWKHIQTLALPGDNECPDLAPTLDENGNIRWVLLGAHDCALVGDFEPEYGFIPAPTATGLPTKLGFGKPYAAQSFNLGNDLRRIRVSWNRVGNTGVSDFTSTLGIPCELTVKSGSVRIAPVRELKSRLGNVELLEKLPAHGLSRSITLPCDITLEYSALEENPIISLCGNRIELSLSGELSVNGERMPFPSSGESVGLRIIADRSGLEVFDTEGRVFGAFVFLPKNDILTLAGEGSLDKLIVRTRK